MRIKKTQNQPEKMGRYLRVGKYKIDNLSTMKTLQDIMNNKKTPSGFWETFGTKSRATTRLKRIFRSVTRQLLDQHAVGKFHGKLKPKYILILHDDFENPYIISWKYTGTGNDDLKAVDRMLKSIFQSTASLPSQWDCELDHFSNMLRNNERNLAYLRNHFWFHSALDRARFFTENVPSVFQFLGSIPANREDEVLAIPSGIPKEQGLPRKSHLYNVCDPPSKKKVKKKKTNFQSTLLFMSHYYSHEMEAGFSVDEIEAEVFNVYPTLMQCIYQTLLKLGVAHNFW